MVPYMLFRSQDGFHRVESIVIAIWQLSVRFPLFLWSEVSVASAWSEKSLTGVK